MRLPGVSIGMGLTNPDSMEPADVLMGVTLDKYPLEYCNRIFGKFQLAITKDEQLCYGPIRGLGASKSAGLCVGDSGSPLLDYRKSCFLGVAISGDFSIHRKRVPSVFINVKFFAGWMRETISHYFANQRLLTFSAL